MKTKGKKDGYIIIGAILVLTQGVQFATEPNFGFADTWSGEGLGFNFAHVFLLLIGIWCLYKGLKKESA